MVNYLSVTYHTSREDYSLHGTTVKTAIGHLNVLDAVVTQMIHNNNLLAIVTSFPDDGYKQIYTIACTTSC